MTGIHYTKFQPTALDDSSLTAIFEAGKKQGMEYLAVYAPIEMQGIKTPNPQYTFLSADPKPNCLKELHRAVWNVSPLGNYFVSAVYNLASPSFAEAKIEFRDPQTGGFLDENRQPD